MTDTTQTPVTVILQALRYLAARCDGAQEQDGAGFNKPDSWQGKQWASKPVLNETEVMLALDMLKKYEKSQLASAGITLPERETARDDALAAVSLAGKITADGPDHLKVSFLYNERFVKAVKAIPSARFNGADKTWRVARAYGKELLAAFPRFEIDAALRDSLEHGLVALPPAGRLTLVGKQIAVSFEYNPDKVTKIKTVPGARFDGVTKRWTVAVEQAARLVELFPDFVLDPSLTDHIAGQHAAQAADAVLGAALTSRIVPTLANGRTLYQHQIDGAKFLLEKRRGILAFDMGTGKLQPVDTLVLTPKGWQTIGSLKVGDYVIGSDGRSTCVKGVFPQGVVDNYRLYFSDGSSVEAGDDHLWSVWLWSGKKHGELITLTTKQMRTGAIIDRKNSNQSWTLDLSKSTLHLPMLSRPVEFEHLLTPLPLPPYLVGALIANGYLTASTPVLSVNALDADEIEQRLIANAVSYRRSEYGTVTRYTIYGIQKQIKALNLNLPSREKHIPPQYLYASPDERIALLHGLMDGDGSISKTNNRISYSTTSSALAKGVRELVEGLGGIASIREYDRTVDQKPIEYTVRIRVPRWVPPCSTSRKMSRYHPSRLAQPGRTFVRAEFSRTVDSVCIAVEADDQLYVTEHCILTHNTLTALVAAKAYQLPVYVICPASLRINWQREAEMVGITIITFSWAKLPDLPTSDFVLIADEAHYAQSIKSIRTKRLLALANSPHCKGVMLLTGTPIKNGRPTNLYPLLVAVQASVAANRRAFEQRYCDAHPTRFTQWDASGASNPDELHVKCKPVMLRKLKSECLDLPAKVRVLRGVELSTEADKAYTTVLKQLRADYKKRITEGKISDQSEALVMLSHLRHAGSVAKTETALELANDVIESGQQIVLFVAFKETGSRLAAALNCSLLSGDASGIERQQMVDDFQAGVTRAIICTHGAGGVGITLTAAQTVVLVDRPYTPGDAVQAEDRLHRIGQQNAVTSIWLQLGDVDIMIDELLQDKQERIDLVLQGKRKTLRGVNGSPADMAAELLPLIFD